MTSRRSTALEQIAVPSDRTLPLRRAGPRFRRARFRLAIRCVEIGRLFSLSKVIERIQENPDEPQHWVPCDVWVQGAFNRGLMRRVALDRLSVKAPRRMAKNRDDDGEAKEQRQRAEHQRRRNDHAPHRDREWIGARYAQ